MTEQPKVEIDPDDEFCLRCGTKGLDTGWECTECGYDNMPFYFSNPDEAKGDGND